MNLSALTREVSKSFSHSTSQSVNQPVRQVVIQPVCHVTVNGSVTYFVQWRKLKIALK